MKNHARGNKGRSGPGYRTPSTFRATVRYRQPLRPPKSFLPPPAPSLPPTQPTNLPEAAPESKKIIP